MPFMAISDAAVPTAQATTNGSAENDDAQLIGKLAKLWAKYNTRSLEVRLETGSLLNARLGPPTGRQPRGQSVLKQAAERLNTAESELNRMRWFAHFSKDEESCWGEIPLGSRSWTQFKQRLPRLIAALKGNEKRQRSSGDKKQTAVVDGLLRLISSATSKIRAEDFTVDGANREALVGKLQAFASAISERFGVRFLVETEEKPDTHGLTKTLAVPGCETGIALSLCPMDTVAV
jgi:hypothetical protein